MLSHVRPSWLLVSAVVDVGGGGGGINWINFTRAHVCAWLKGASEL